MVNVIFRFVNLDDLIALIALFTMSVKKLEIFANIFEISTLML